MNKKTFWIVIALVIAIVLLVALRDSRSRKADQNSPITIGADFSLTDFGASWGEYDRDAALLAVKQINAAGGVNGKPVALDIEDNASKTESAVNAATKLISVDHAQFLLSGWADQTNAIAPLLAQNKVIGITVSAGSADITKQSGWLFRTWPKDAFLSQALAQYIGSKKYAKVATFRTIGSWEDSVAPMFADQVKAVGASVVDEEKVSPDSTDVKASLAKIASAKPDVIYIVAFEPNTAAFIKAIRAQGNRTPILFATELNSPSILKGVSGIKDLEGIVYPLYQASSDQFVKDFTAEYGHAPGVSADTTYDAVNLIAQAIKDAGSTDPEAIRAALSKMSGFHGASGDVSFDQDRDRQSAPVVLMTVKDGKFVPLQ